jgi:hypothetical protein
MLAATRLTEFAAVSDLACDVATASRRWTNWHHNRGTASPPRCKVNQEGDRIPFLSIEIR